MFNVVKNRNYFFGFSLLLTILSIISIFTWKLNLSIDFRGGSNIEISLPNAEENLNKIREIGRESGLKIDSVRTSDNNKVIISFTAAMRNNNLIIMLIG